MKALFTISLSLLLHAAFAQQKVVLDQYYNNETNEKTGKAYHYLWEDKELTGFSQLGELLTSQGAELKTLKAKPDKSNLKDADVYIIADPDTKAETSKPNFLDKEASGVIAKWVKKGGVLLLLANDSENADLEHTNILMKRFGMAFENEVIHRELSEPGKPRNFNSCVSSNLPSHPIFEGVSKIFIKGVAPISVVSPAQSVLSENGKILIAQAKYGKGLVIAIGDPWLYNEYIDNKILPAEINNLKAAENLVKLLLKK